MAKFLLLIAVFVIAYMVIKNGSKRGDSAKRGPDAGREEDMVRCKICGLHLPRSESLRSGDEFYCSEEHLRIAKKN